MPFELQVALRYLTARRKQAFISVISSISVLGVVVGVMALMVALGLMTGLQREIRSRILGATAHISVFKSRSDNFDEYREVVERVRKAPRVQGAAPALYGKGLLTSGTAQTSPPFIPTIIGEGGLDWPAMAAGTTLFLLPVLLFTVLLRKHLLRGVTFGAIRK